ncbi:hypothetical protein MKX01_028241 [Papaver californicum]|nr:hypothetical protein MKX01_028241 [Papaver californicum]
MLGKTTRPIGKLLKPEFSGHRAMFPEEITSPKSPLDFKIRSPRGGMTAIGGVGLGILAALEKSGSGRSEIQMRFIAGNLNLNSNRGSTATTNTNTNTTTTATATSIPVPIPIGSTNAVTRNCREVLMDEQDSESYTYVTLHKPNNQSYTRVYCDHGGDHELVSKVVVHNDNNDSKMRRINMGVFCESPPRRNESEFEFPTSDFLSSCFLCRKKLHGKDIFMYRGEKAFCSSECRHRQIVSDERQEKCRSEASRYRDISISPYSGGGQLFTAGITAS